ncbi:MAG: BamA/TamA family outer membrane protein [Bacteroidota bacterium]
MSKLPYLSAIFAIISQLTASQSMLAGNCQVVWEGDSLSIHTFRELMTGTNFCDSLSALQSMIEVQRVLHEEGYLLASLDYRYDSLEVTIGSHLGEKYSWAKLDLGNLPDIILSKTSKRESDLVGQKISPKNLSKLMDRFIVNSENSGFPFASIHLDSIEVSQSTIYARLNYDPGPAITFDSIRLPIDIKTKREWLESYLGIKPGALYSQQIVDDISKNLYQLPFINLLEPPAITFQNKEATVILNLDEKRVSTADGIIGFLPNEEEPGRLLITGQFDLSLRNLFKSGKSLDLKWQSLKARSQLLDVKYHHPNIFRSALDIETNFNLLKEDTLFLTRSAFLGLSHRNKRSRFRVFTRFFSSGLLGNNDFENITILPETVDLNTVSYGLGYDFSSVDLAFAPKRGFYLNSTLAAGTKEIERNADIPPELYDQVDLSSVQYSGELSVGAYFRLTSNFVLHSHLDMGGVFNNQLFFNDLYRIGGLNSLRGFNENFFFAEQYLNATAEVQFYFQEYSYLFTFFDQAYLQYDLETSSFRDYPFGLGLGLSLFTGSGNVNLVYALGKSAEQELGLNLSKFHFGYVARF